MALTNDDALELVIGLACLTEHRTDEEQRALLTVARGLDDRRNANVSTNRRMYGRLAGHVEASPIRPLSAWEAFVDQSRVLHDDDKRVRLKRRKRDPGPDTTP